GRDGRGCKQGQSAAQQGEEGLSDRARVHDAVAQDVPRGRRGDRADLHPLIPLLRRMPTPAFTVVGEASPDGAVRVQMAGSFGLAEGGTLWSELARVPRGERLRVDMVAVDRL